MTRHYIKCTKPVFDLIAQGRKTAEVRFNDRLYQSGDTLIIHEGIHWSMQPNGTLQPNGVPVAPTSVDRKPPEPRVAVADVLSVINGGQFGIENGYVLLSLAPSNIVSYDDYINNRGA